MLTVEGVVKRYGGVLALDGVSLHVEPGTITGVIGPNGSGKSTLFDVVTGIVPLDAGRVALDGTPLSGARPDRIARRGVVRTFQVPRLARRMTVLENLMLAPLDGEGERVARLFSPWHVGRVRADERRRLERAREMAAELRLERVANDFAGTLSGGQLKLLSAGIALMADPRVLLLDEPMAGVSPTLVDHLSLMLRARRDRGLTTLIIEHNLSVVADLCSTCHVLHEGRVLESGAPEAVRGSSAVLDAYIGRSRFSA